MSSQGELPGDLVPKLTLIADKRWLGKGSSMESSCTVDGSMLGGPFIFLRDRPVNK